MDTGPRALKLSAAERAQLEAWVAGSSASRRLVIRCCIVLRASGGLSVTAIAGQLRVSRGTVRLWCRRFESGGPAALADARSNRAARGRG